MFNWATILWRNELARSLYVVSETEYESSAMTTLSVTLGSSSSKSWYVASQVDVPVFEVHVVSVNNASNYANSGGRATDCCWTTGFFMGLVDQDIFVELCLLGLTCQEKHKGESN